MDRTTTDHRQRMLHALAGDRGAATLQNTIKRAYSEWFPASGKEHSGGAEIEFYPQLPDTSARDYWCEYWIPIK